MHQSIDESAVVHLFERNSPETTMSNPNSPETTKLSSKIHVTTILPSNDETCLPVNKSEQESLKALMKETDSMFAQFGPSIVLSDEGSANISEFQDAYAEALNSIEKSTALLKKMENEKETD